MVDQVAVSLEINDIWWNDDGWTLVPLTFLKTDIFLVCFSLASRISFENVSSIWLPLLQKHSPEVPFILVGNKSDLRQTQMPNHSKSVFRHLFNKPLLGLPRDLTRHVLQYFMELFVVELLKKTPKHLLSRDEYRALWGTRNGKELCIQYEEGLNLAKQIGAVKYMETSSVTSVGVKNVFDESIRSLLFKNTTPKKSRVRPCTIQ